MKEITRIAAVIALSASSVVAQSATPTTSSAGEHDAIAAKRPESAFACNRLALTSEQRKRHFDELGPKLRAMKKSVRELPNGYEFEFLPDSNTIQLVAEWVAGERVCCPFFDINMRVEREGGPLWLSLTGREGVKQFIQADGAVWIKR